MPFDMSTAVPVGFNRRTAYPVHEGMTHEIFTPPDNPIGEAIVKWGKGVEERTKHPLEAIAKAAVDVTKMSPEELAMNWVGHGIGGIAGIFSGVGAKTANLAALDVAQEMKAAGIADDVIHAKTGWFSGMPDGKWRFEIPDNAAKFNALTRDGVKVEQELLNGLGDMNLGSTLDLVEHPKLINAYGADLSPNTFIRNKNTILGDGPQGSFHEGTTTLYAPATAQDAKSTTLHELQHAIQQREGFARGGSPEMMSYEGLKNQQGEITQKMLSDFRSGKPTNPQLENQLSQIDGLIKEFQTVGSSGFSGYKRLAGEAEARLTQARMNMTPEERAASYPPSMFDVPADQQIVRYGDGTAMSAEDVKPKFDINTAQPVSE